MTAVARSASSRAAGAAAAAAAAGQTAARLLGWTVASSSEGETSAGDSNTLSAGTDSAAAPAPAGSLATTVEQAAPLPLSPGAASCAPARATAGAAVLAPRPALAVVPSSPSIFAPPPPLAAPVAATSSARHDGSAQVDVLGELLSSTLTIDHRIPLSASFASVAARKAFDSLMDVDPSSSPGTDEMLSDALALKIGCLTLDDASGQEESDGRYADKVKAESALARAIGTIKREQSEALRARSMDVDDDEADPMEVQGDVGPEVVVTDRMDVDGEEEAKRRRKEMRALLNEGRGRRSRSRRSAVLAKTMGGGEVSPSSRDHCAFSLRKLWKEGKLLTL